MTGKVDNKKDNSDVLLRKIGNYRWKRIFWHKSSVTESRDQGRVDRA